MTELDWLVGSSAILAAVATIVGAVTLVLFFAKGGAWGLANDVASIVLMLATIPLAVALADLKAATLGWAGLAAAVGIAGMVGTIVSQGLLVARVATYRQLLPWTLGFGAVVGVWYILVGIGGVRLGRMFGPEPLDALAIAAGIGFILLGYGFLRGNERHPLSIAGGLVTLAASTLFLTGMGILFISGDIHGA